MFSNLKMTIHQISEIMSGNNIKDLYQNRIYKDRVLVPVEMDLTGEIPFCGHQNPNYQFIEVKLKDLEDKIFSYAITSRYYKAIQKLKSGFRSFAIVKDKTIIGDVWCTATDANGKPTRQHDAYLTGLYCQDWEIYAFNLAIAPSFRGKNFAIPLQRYLQSTLKSEGYKKVYGYYWLDNINALWMHRLLKFKEYPKRKVTRLLRYTKVEEYEYAEQPSILLEPLPITAEFCWDYKNCNEDKKLSCRAYIQTEKQCWDLFLEDGELRESCKVCQFRLAKMPAT